MERNMQQSLERSTATNGLQLAKLIKYTAQFHNPYIVKRLSIERISATTLYNKNKKLLDKMAEVLIKYKLDPTSYVNFYFDVLKKHTKDLQSSFANIITVRQYLEYAAIKESRTKIYKYFMKSVKNAADECIKNNYNDVIDFIRHIVKNRKISAYLVSGKLSIYWFAAIKGFKKVIEKMDSISRDEFSKLYTRFDKYSEDINQAMLQMKNMKASAIKITNDEIALRKIQFHNIIRNRKC